VGRKIATADCETDPFKKWRVPRPFVWGFYDGETYHQFEKTADFVAHVREFDGIVYAHNGGKFDWHFFLDELEAFDEVMIINGRLARFQLGLAELRDSYNIIPVPLAAYKKDKVDYKIFEHDKRYIPKNWKIITDYLKSDCVYLYELVERMIDDYGLHLTQAGAAMSQWKDMAELGVPESDPDYYDRLFPYYYGGRVQCFETGVLDGNFAVYDINSAYPFAMLVKHPYSTDGVEVPGFVESADFYRVRCISLGVFPFRHDRGDGGATSLGLSFPEDNEVREYYVTKWEFDAAIETLSIYDVEVVSSIVYANHTDFSGYILHYYRYRQECAAAGDEAGKLFGKLLMNSLYGKFAADPRRYRNSMIAPLESAIMPEKQNRLAELGWTFTGELGPWALVQGQLEESRQRFYNIATAASITGFVRAMIWRAICDGSGILYCDTDSIAIRHVGENMPMGDALGQWKHEGDFFKAGIAGKKLYIFEGKQGKKKLIKRACKGAKLTDKQLWRVASGEEIRYEPEAPTFSTSKAPVMKAWEDQEIARKMFTVRRIRPTAPGFQGLETDLDESDDSE
jgi:hypothetical protein